MGSGRGEKGGYDAARRSARQGATRAGGPRNACCPERAPPPILRRVKIYTRTGDDGTTGLLGPGRVRKDDPRVAAYGDVDELNAALGLARAHDRDGWLTTEIGFIQTRLFALGAELAATTPAPLAGIERVTDVDVTALEGVIDRLEADLAPLQNFVVPGGAPLGAALHLARTVCRRAERSLVTLQATAAIEPRLIRYLNRLADLLFVMARWANHRAGVAETEWRSRKDS